MRREANSLLLMDGPITRIRFGKESTFLEFRHPKEGDMTVEFRNAKKNRADLVKKMRFNVGEKVAIVGSWSSNNPCYMFGYEVERSGRLSAGRYTLFKGVAGKMKVFKSSILLDMTYDQDKEIKVKIPGSIINEHINTGDEIAVMCIKASSEDCSEKCKRWGINKCEGCRKRQKTTHFVAVEYSVYPKI